MIAIRGADAQRNTYVEVYSMIYDSQDRGNNGYGEKLGMFRVIQQITEDGWEDTFIGENMDTHEICLILSHEICGFGGGISYQVYPLPSLTLKESTEVEYA